ncbi:MAG: hypothetical protein WCV93_03625 [Candidatus Shapirobacteria bacterium]|jgi:hypothetical protein
MKKWQVSWWLLLIFLVGIGFLRLAWGRADGDLRIASFGDWGVELVNISIQRRLVSVSRLPADFKLWIPGGYGWYEAGKVGKLLVVAKEGSGLVNKILFFNFGLIPDKIMIGDDPDWWRGKLALANLSNLRWWWNWQVSRGVMLEKNEVMAEFTGERMEREYANIDWLSLSNLRWVVVNRSGLSGLATMVAKRLEWAGVLVSGVVNDMETNTNCRVKMINNLTETDEQIVNSINSILGCDLEIIDDENVTEVVVELGKDWGQMLKYNNYVRSF